MQNFSSLRQVVSKLRLKNEDYGIQHFKMNLNLIYGSKIISSINIWNQNYVLLRKI